MIVSEDDNIFAPAFLDYINKGLEKFKEDRSVLSINGYRHFYDVKFNGNNFYRQNVDFSAWGYGIWRNRIEMTSQACNTTYWRKKALNPLNWIKISKNGWNRLLVFLRLTAKSATLNDNGLSVYMGINNLNVVMPNVSMVRNMGWDGSGEHCRGENELSKLHNEQELYSLDSYDFKGSGYEYYAENHNIYVSQSYGRITFLQLLKNLGRIIKSNFLL